MEQLIELGAGISLSTALSTLLSTALTTLLTCRWLGSAVPMGKHLGANYELDTGVERPSNAVTHHILFSTEVNEACTHAQLMCEQLGSTVDAVFAFDF